MLVLSNRNNYTISCNKYIDTNIIYGQYPRVAYYRGIDNHGNDFVHRINGNKPNGLWYAYGRAWVDFSQQHHLLAKVKDHELPPIFNVSINKDNYYIIDSVEDIYSFNSKYALGITGKKINWFKVARSFDGFEVSNFCRNKSDLYWYKSFDISSGCLWNLQKIINIVKVNNV